MRAPRLSVGGRAPRERSIEQVATALTRQIVHLQAKQRKLRAALKDTGAAIKTAKRELRTVLQRSSSLDLDSLELAGKADGADRAVALTEQRAHDRLVSKMCGELAADARRTAKNDVGF